MRYILSSLSALIVAGFAMNAAWADNAPSYQLVLKNHTFSPSQLTIPANKEIVLTVKNLDPTPAEFESEDFEVEKVVPASGEISVHIAPLKAGTYGFFDDFHEDETKGTLVAE